MWSYSQSYRHGRGESEEEEHPPHSSLPAGILHGTMKKSRSASSGFAASAHAELHPLRESDVLLDLSGFQAASADLYMPDGAIVHGPELDEVWPPDTASPVLGVRDVISEKRSLTADFTNSRHDSLR